ncbi:hypothetical protein E4U42_001038 [Claviceps africana]|uniref:Protein kinase domain-containing protein n=1 Tax=Claviceps africana TaxID=83212 RepID=A0A8K0NJR4_9HYPO|nr:hypothetical protein E4U42_001038 [Claviceps africana]
MQEDRVGKAGEGFLLRATTQDACVARLNPRQRVTHAKRLVHHSTSSHGPNVVPAHCLREGDEDGVPRLGIDISLHRLGEANGHQSVACGRSTWTASTEILGEDGDERRVVYHLDLIPGKGPDVRARGIRELSRLAEWNGRWKTLTISKDAGHGPTSSDHTACPGNRCKVVDGPLPCFSIFDPRPMTDVKNRVLPRPGERGPSAYSRFLGSASKSPGAWIQRIRGADAAGLGPSCFVCSGRPDRVGGLVFEAIPEPPPGHLARCREASQRLHSLHVVHGDINRYNILVTQDGSEITSTEVAEIGLRRPRPGWTKEMADLEKQLLEESGNGPPVLVSRRIVGEAVLC